MPKIFMYKGFVIFIGTNEIGEPVHVHVSKGSPSKSNVKIWALSDGTFEIQKNPDYRIVPAKILHEICNQLMDQYENIVSTWFSINGSLKFKDSRDSKTSLFS